VEFGVDGSADSPRRGRRGAYIPPVMTSELDPAFVDDCPYGPEGILIDKILDIDEASSRIVARMPSHDDLPITRTQRAHPVRHPRHVAGGLMVHATGIVGFAHAYYLLGLRHAEGWIGYGAKIHGARFHSIAGPGDPIIIDCRATKLRRGDKRVLGRYEFRFTQNDRLVYEGDQTAMFFRVEEGDSLDLSAG